MVRQVKLVPKSEKLRSTRCAVCRAMLNLCGRGYCPIVKRIQVQIRIKDLVKSDVIFGASPPSVFIGERNYPRVHLGPMVPPIARVDTSIMDDPSQWLDKTVDQIINYRISLIRSHDTIHVSQHANPKKSLEVVQELAMSSLPVDTEVKLTKPPIPRITFSQWTPPMGPTAPLKDVKLVENPKVHPKVDYLTGDTDVLATTAITELYNAGIPIYQLTRLLSVGLLGRSMDRKIVPTKWSITATDDMLGKRLHHQILDYPEINEFQVFGDYAVGNKIWILLLPTPWMFEVLECWLPGTIFLSSNYQPNIPSDHELTKGRKTYAATITGAYYAARLPVLEYLSRERRQAGAIIFFEVHPDWAAPLGVWRVREICRRALTKPPQKYNAEKEALEELAKHLKAPIQSWIDSSKLLTYYKAQKTLRVCA